MVGTEGLLEMLFSDAKKSPGDRKHSWQILLCEELVSGQQMHVWKGCGGLAGSDRVGSEQEAEPSGSHQTHAQHCRKPA